MLPKVFAAVSLACVAPLFLAADPGVRLVQRDGRLRLETTKPAIAPIAGTRLEIRYETSSDFRKWVPGGPLAPARSGYQVAEVGTAADSGFFRVNSSLVAGGSADPADQLGFNRVFDAELERLGQISVAEFSRQYAPTFLAGISFDPTTAKFWDHFNADPAVVNATVPVGGDRRLHDFRLNDEEMARFRTNGFVVSERLGSYSFADVYYKIFADDLPVFITTDSVLHAWHFSFQKMLEELEETHIAVTYEQMLDGMATNLPALAALRGGPLRESVDDADYFLAVARSLIKGAEVPPVFVDAGTVSQTLAKIGQTQFEPFFELWGKSQPMDFSQFIVRGHYTGTPRLQRYFRAFNWTALADFGVVDIHHGPQSLRELGTAVVLQRLVGLSGQGQRWQSVNQLLKLSVGRQNSMGIDELGAALTAIGSPALEDVTPGTLVQLQTDLLNGRVGLPDYAAGPFYGNDTGVRPQLSARFAFTGKRFIADGWVQSMVTYDRIRWEGEGVPERYRFGDAVVRRFPSALDVAFAVFGNDGVVGPLAERMMRTDGLSFRDGLPYQHNLVAARRTMDAIATEYREESIYGRWLYALRNLSQPANDPRLPQAMRTRGWAMKDANTQSASWSQLRHDTLLYAAEPYTSMILCEYPAGFVEPRPEFWEQMDALALFTHNLLVRYPVNGEIFVPAPMIGIERVDLGARHQARLNFCHNFSQITRVLGTLARRHLRQEAFSPAEQLFIRSVMNSADRNYGGKTYTGWYPSLFYKSYGQAVSGWDSVKPDTNGSDRRDHVVVGVHTAPADAFDPEGGVLHEGVGDVDLLMIAVDNGPDRMVFAGPTMSHYEFIEKGPVLNRLTDQQWSSRVLSTNRPPRPDWTQSYLVPR